MDTTLDAEGTGDESQNGRIVNLIGRRKAVRNSFRAAARNSEEALGNAGGFLPSLVLPPAREAMATEHRNSGVLSKTSVGANFEQTNKIQKQIFFRTDKWELRHEESLDSCE